MYSYLPTRPGQNPRCSSKARASDDPIIETFFEPLFQSIAERFGIGGYPQRSVVSRAEDIGGWMSPDELEFLRQLASGASDFTEIGSWKGRSTFAIAEACTGTVYAVDRWESDDVFHQFQRNLARFPNVCVCRMDSQAAADSLPETDVVFIDGAHDYYSVRTDLRTWKSKATRILCGHDFNWCGVRRAVAEELGSATIHRGPGSIWLTEQTEAD